MSVTSGLASRKRTATSPPASVSERSSKRNRPNVRDEQSIGEGSERTTPSSNRGGFQMPSNANDLKEDRLAILFNEEENPDESSDADVSQVRRLSNFIFFYADTTQQNGLHDLVGLERLQEVDRTDIRRVISAHGATRMDDADLDEAAFEGPEAEDDPENPGPAPLQFQYHEVILDSIEAWWIGDGVSNADMYIRTTSAWYILEEPEDSYRKTFRFWWIPHRLSQVMADYSLKAPDNSFDQFCGALTTLSGEAEIMVDRRQITENDVLFYRSVIQDDLTRHPLSTSLAETKVVKKFFEVKGVELRSGQAGRSLLAPPGADATSSRIYITPLVRRVAQKYFKTPLEAIGTMPKYFSVNEQNKRREPVISVSRPLPVRETTGDKGSIKYYGSLLFEKKYYKIGDYVAVVIGRSSSLELRLYPPPPSTNELANRSWFARIHRLFTTFEAKAHPPTREWAHVQWFQHGRVTDLGELAAPNELFDTFQCSDIGLASVRQFINVQHVDCASDAIIPPGDDDSIAKDTFFCRYLYQWEDGSYRDLSQPKPMELAPKDKSKLTERLIKCPVCDARVAFDREEGAVSALTTSPSGVVLSVLWKNTPFHKRDTILYFEDDDIADAKPRRMQVGVVTGWSLDARRPSLNICKIQKLLFRDDVVKAHTLATTILPVRTALPLDERCLIITPEVIEIGIKDIERHCVVHGAPNWREYSHLDSEPDHFFLTHQTHSFKPTFRDLSPIQRSPLKPCEFCGVRTEMWRGFREPYKVAARKKKRGLPGGDTQLTLRALDLYAGAGGLSLGIQNLGLFSAAWAVERDVDTARSYQRNFPGAKVYTQDLNICAQNALRPPRNRKPIESLDTEKQDPPQHMPLKGEVDAIFAGPPCPDFSIQNIHRHRSGETNTGLVLSVLGLIDFYRPRFFMIENVPGMLRHEAIDQETGEVVYYAMVKIILRILTALGYSVRWGIFNAANFGTPQLRTRLVFYGSRGGHRLPDIPIPSHITHTNPRVSFTRFTGQGTHLTEPDGTHPWVSIAAAIGDLPPFEWKVPSPELEIPIPYRPGVPQFFGESERGQGLAGFTLPEGAEYAQAKPATLYQARARAGVRAENRVTLHFTRTFAQGRSLKAERVISVPLLAKADHRKIPQELNDWAHSHALSAAARTRWAPGRYGRLDWQGQFQSAITRIDPTAKQGRVLHPSQRRILTLREAARSQGFPDHFVFSGDAKSIIRQIGNGVPIQLGEAFGRAFRDAVICHRLWTEQKFLWPVWEEPSDDE